MPEVLSVEEALKENESVFVGHPADTSSQDEPVEEPELDPEVEPDPDLEIDTEVEPETNPDFKYKSHEEAEKGARETLKLREKDIGQIKDLQAKIFALEEKAAERAKGDADNFSIDNDIVEEFANELRGIDEEAFDGDPYERQAQIQLKVMDKIARKREAAASAGRKAADDRQRQDEEVISLATSTARDSGLNMDKDSVDYTLFWDISSRAQGNTVEDRIKDTITKVNDLKAALIKKDDDRKEKVKATQENNKVLVSGVRRTTVETNNKGPVTVAGAFEEVAAERRI